MKKNTMSPRAFRNLQGDICQRYLDLNREVPMPQVIDMVLSEKGLVLVGDARELLVKLLVTPRNS